MKETVILIVLGMIGTVFKSLGKKTGGIGNQRKNRDYTDSNFGEIGQKTVMIPENLSRLVVTQSQGKKPPANSDVKNSLEIRNFLLLLVPLIIYLSIFLLNILWKKIYVLKGSNYIR